MIEDTIFTNPLPLLAIKNPKLVERINQYLPYSSAFEVECRKQPSFDITTFEEIPDIMSVNCGNGEQRFRVPSGLKGLVCLYHISEQLKLNSELNPESGIHYHVDCTDCWDLINARLVSENAKWILEELDTWSPEYTTRGRGICGFSGDKDLMCKIPYGGWLRFNSLKTMEFRVGEMTFDYSILAKRMIHCNEIVRKFKFSMREGIHKLELEQLQQKLKDLRIKKQEEVPDTVFKDVAQEVVKSRTRRI